MEYVTATLMLSAIVNVILWMRWRDAEGALRRRHAWEEVQARCVAECELGNVYAGDHLEVARAVLARMKP